jgi:hypothetical protein
MCQPAEKRMKYERTSNRLRQRDKIDMKQKKVYLLYYFLGPEASLTIANVATKWATFCEIILYQIWIPVYIMPETQAMDNFVRGMEWIAVQWDDCIAPWGGYII